MKKCFLAIKPDDELVAYFPIVFQVEKDAIKWCDRNEEYKYTECLLKQ